MKLRTVVAAVVALWLVLGAAGVHCGIPRFQQAHPSQASATLKVGQAHLADGSASSCPAKFATAALPRATIPLAALAVVAAVGISTGWLVPLRVPRGRSPPAGPAFRITGRSLLTRFCLARR